ncbi:MAG: hypothetical protein QOE61_5723 [Micromonosporaceae bacterium]|nr:hypothetical protein [Micromonosporaceae bacterium]
MQRLALGPHRDNLISLLGMLSSTGGRIFQHAGPTIPTLPGGRRPAGGGQPERQNEGCHQATPRYRDAAPLLIRRRTKLGLSPRCLD